MDSSIQDEVVDQKKVIERMVGCFKSISKKVIGSSKMTYEEFSAVVVEAEGIINSRPITYDYSSPNEEAALSPAKILYGYNLTEIPPMSKSQHVKVPEVTGTSTLQRFWFLESVKTSFRNRWLKEYLTSLTERHLRQAKSKGVEAVPAVGEVVLLKREKYPRHKWRLARVLEVIEKRGKVRQCVVMTHNDEGKLSIMNRSPSFLVPLELRVTDEERKVLEEQLHKPTRKCSYRDKGYLNLTKKGN